MSSTVNEIATLVGGRIEETAEGDAAIRGIASTLDAREGDITFFGNARYLSELENCSATAALVPLEFDREIAPIRIFVENPTLAFSKLVERFTPPPRKPAVGVAKSAVVESNVVLGDNVSIGHHVLIESGAKIGSNTVIDAGVFIGVDSVIGSDCHFYPNVTIRERSVIGNRVIIQPGAVIGGDGYGFQFSEGRHVKIPQLGIVQIDDDVEIGSGTTIDRARFGRTWIQEGTKIDNLVQIGHNVVVGKHCLIVAMVGISGSTKLEDYVTIGGHAGIAGHLKLGRACSIAGFSGVIKDVPPKAILSGYPARDHKEFLAGQAQLRRLGLLSSRMKRLESALEEKGIKLGNP